MAVLKNLVMRGASQRLGGMVLYQLKGQTLARELAPAVSNPRTPAQMDNRVRLQNVVSVYRANRAWMAGAFENKKERESDYNAFVSANLSSSQVAFTKQQAAAGAAVAAPYQITSGSLGSIEQIVSESELQTNIYLGDLIMTTTTTVGEFSRAIINNNNGLVEGMQLSLILNIQQVNQVTSIPYIICRAYEVILDTSSPETLSQYFPDELLASGGGAENILYADLSEQGSGAASFILSHTVSATTRVSEQSLLMFGSQTVYNQYTSAEAIAAAVSSYGENEVNFLDSNSAQQSGDVPVGYYVQGISYDGVLVPNGGNVIGPLITTASVNIYITKPLPQGVGGILTVRNVTANEDVPCDSATISSNRQLIIFRVSSDYGVDVRSRIEITYSLGDAIINAFFYLMPAS